MKSLRLSLTFSAETIPFEHRFVCESPAVDRQLILGGQVHDGTETTISFVEGDPGAYERQLETEPTLEEYRIAPAHDGFFCCVRRRLDERGTAMFEAFHEETIAVVPPYEFRADRTMRTTVVGAPDDLRAVLDGFPDGISVDVLRVGDYVGGPVGVLSSRQREAIDVAWECGFYEVPRTGGIEDVAAELDCAVSTASDLLRRAQSRLVANALDAPR